MATLKELKIRITGIKGTQKITRAMKMVASAKMRRAQDRIISMRPYAKRLDELLSHLAESAGDEINKILEQREVKHRLVVVISADRGLAGSFNSSLIRFALNYINSLPKDTKLIVIGKKANDALKKKNFNIVKSYVNLFNNLTFEASNEIINYIIDGYRKKSYDSVDLIFNEFRSVVKQVAVKEQLLPLAKPKKDETSKKIAVDYIYEPGASEILKELIPKQYRIKFWKALLESNAAEQAARMTAMETATRNASDLLKMLELSYNQARQAAITKEILEIVGGAEALKEN